jgi:hypothetical protein
LVYADPNHEGSSLRGYRTTEPALGECLLLGCLLEPYLVHLFRQGLQRDRRCTKGCRDCPVWQRYTAGSTQHRLGKEPWTTTDVPWCSSKRATGDRLRSRAAGYLRTRLDTRGGARKSIRGRAPRIAGRQGAGLLRGQGQGYADSTPALAVERYHVERYQLDGGERREGVPANQSTLSFPVRRSEGNATRERADAVTRLYKLRERSY